MTYSVPYSPLDVSVTQRLVEEFLRVENEMIEELLVEAMALQDFDHLEQLAVVYRDPYGFGGGRIPPTVASTYDPFSR